MAQYVDLFVREKNPFIFDAMLNRLLIEVLYFFIQGESQT